MNRILLGINKYKLIALSISGVVLKNHWPTKCDFYIVGNISSKINNLCIKFIRTIVLVMS